MYLSRKFTDKDPGGDSPVSGRSRWRLSGLYSNPLPLHKQLILGWRVGSAGKNTDCSSRGPEFKSQRPHGGSQPSVKDAFSWLAGVHADRALLPANLWAFDLRALSLLLQTGTQEGLSGLFNPSTQEAGGFQPGLQSEF